MSIKQKLLSGEITFKKACATYYNDLTQERVDIVELNIFLLKITKVCFKMDDKNNKERDGSV